MSRTRLPFVLFAAALLAAAVAISACGGGSDKSGESASSVLDEATLEGVDSGRLDLTLALTARGKEGGNLDVSLSGPFQSEGKGSLPRLDMTAKANGSIGGKPVDFEAGLVLLPGTAYIGYEGVEYKVDPTTYSYLEGVLKEAQREAGAETGSAGAAACQEEFGKLEVADFLAGAGNEGSAAVDGTATTKVSGDLDVSGAIGTVLEAVESPACRAQLAAAGPLPSEAEIEKAKDQVSDSLKGAPHVDVYVGDDDIVRRISAQLTIEPKESNGGPRSVRIDLDLKLTGVNEEQEIAAPDSAKPLSKLFLKLGVNPIELLGLLEGEGEGLNELLEGLGASQLR
jgi:hypothetical protein